MTKFCKSVADVLEVEDVTLDTKFRETDGWCSLMGFGLLVMMENDFHAPLTVDEFLGLTTVRDLYREAMCALAARVFGVATDAVRNANYGSIPQWDSVNHLRLVMEAEELFGAAYSIERIPELRSIDDFCA